MWPTVGIRPPTVPEHAAQLKSESTLLLERLSSPGSNGSHIALPYRQAEAFIESVHDFTEKICAQPSMAEIMAELRGLTRTQGKINESVTVIKNVIENPQGSTQDTATTKYKATQLWSKVVSQRAGAPPTQASYPSSFLAPSGAPRSDISDPKERELIIKGVDFSTTEGLRLRDSTHIRTRVNNAIKTSRAPGGKISVIAAKILKSNDLQVTTATVAEAESLREDVEWVKSLGTKAHVVVTTYGVLMHGVPVKSMDMNRMQVMIERLVSENRVSLGEVEVTFMRWLKRDGDKKKHTSAVVEFKTPEQANKAIKCGLIWDAQVLGCQRYDRTCRKKQCFRCQNYGHMGAQCQSPHPACSYCAGEHDYKECPTPEVKKCAVCKGPHDSKYKRCPAVLKEEERIKQAILSSSEYWPERSPGIIRTASPASSQETDRTTTTSQALPSIPETNTGNSPSNRSESPDRGAGGATGGNGNGRSDTAGKQDRQAGLNSRSATTNTQSTSNQPTPTTGASNRGRQGPASIAGPRTPVAIPNPAFLFRQQVEREHQARAIKEAEIRAKGPQTYSTQTINLASLPPTPNLVEIRKRKASRSPAKLRTGANKGPTTASGGNRTPLGGIDGNKRLRVKSTTTTKKDAEERASEVNNGSTETPYHLDPDEDPANDEISTGTGTEPTQSTSTGSWMVTRKGERERKQSQKALGIISIPQ